MTASSDRAKPSLRGIIGLAGIFFFFISIPVGFVVVMEYDPTARDYKSSEIMLEARVVRKIREAPSGPHADLESDIFKFEVEPLNTPGTRLITAGYLDEFEWRHQQLNETITLKQIPGQPEQVAVMTALPPTPRRALDFIFPGILMLIGTLLIVMDPDVLYGFQVSTKELRTEGRVSIQ